MTRSKITAEVNSHGKRLTKKKKFNLESQRICTTALSNSASSWHCSLYSHQKFISFHKIRLEFTCLFYTYTNTFQIYIHVSHHLSERQHSYKVQKFDLLGIFSYRFLKIQNGLYSSFNSSVQICWVHVYKLWILKLQEASEPITDCLLQHQQVPFILIWGV